MTHPCCFSIVHVVNPSISDTSCIADIYLYVRTPYLYMRSSNPNYLHVTKQTDHTCHFELCIPLVL